MRRRPAANRARVALFVFALLAAFAAPFARGAAAQALDPVYVSGVPNIPEDDWIPNCGPAAVSDVVRSYEPAVTYEQVLHAVLNRYVGGTYLSTVVRFGRSLGFKMIEDRFTTVHDPQLRRLYDYIAAGTPVLVEQSATLEDVTLHMRVVVGVDPRAREVIFTDPMFGPGYRVGFADFARLQENGPNSYIVFVPRDPKRPHSVLHQMPDFGKPLPLQRRRLYVEQAYDMVQRGEIRSAASFLAEHVADFEGRERAIMAEHTAYYARLGGYSHLALRMLDMAQKEFGQFQWIAIERARDVAALGDMQGARRTIQPYAATLGADDLLFYGDVLRELGERAAAIEAYRRAERMDGGRLEAEVRWRMALLGA